MRGHVWCTPIVCLMWASAFAACRDERAAGRDAGDEPLRLRDGGRLPDAGAAQAGVRGVVVDVLGNRIGEAPVAVGAYSALTNARGEFELLGLAAPSAAVLTVALSGYSTGRVALRLSANVTPSIKVVLQRAELVELLDPSRGGQVRTDGGTVIELPQQAIVDGNGELVRAPVTVSVALINDRDEMAAAPGRALGFDPNDATAGVSPLESFGMVEIGMSSRGERVQLRDGSEVALSFPMTANHPFHPGDAVELWRYDDDAEAWAPAGDGVIGVSNQLTATVSHFSFWNAGRKLTKTCAVGRVVDATGAPIAALDIMAEGRSYLGHTRTDSDATGNFCLEARVASVVELSALLQADEVDLALAVRVDMPSVPGDCGQPEGCYVLPRDLVAVAAGESLCDPSDCPPAPAGTEACCITDLGPCSIVIRGDCGGSEDGAWDPAPDVPGLQEIPGVPLGWSSNTLPEAGPSHGFPAMDASVAVPDAAAPDHDPDGGDAGADAARPVSCVAPDVDAGPPCVDPTADAGDG